MKEEDYIKKWLDSSLSEEEKRLFTQSENSESNKKMSGALEHFKAPAYSAEEEYARFLSKRSKAKVVPFKRSYVLLKVAAVFVMVLGFVFYLTSDFYTSTPELISDKMRLTLPDATAVVLNTHSKLTYDEEGWSDNRRAYLTGEGFFEVSRGKKFDIICNSGTVSVLGTSFNIKDRKNFFEVKCYEGLVKVVADGREYLLSAQQAYRKTKGEGEKITFSENTGPSWVKGESSFEQVPFLEVLREVERQYGVSISYENIDTQLSFSGKFTHSDLTLALESITRPLNIGFEVSGRQVRLSSDIKRN